MFVFRHLAQAVWCHPKRERLRNWHVIYLFATLTKHPSLFLFNRHHTACAMRLHNLAKLDTSNLPTGIAEKIKLK